MAGADIPCSERGPSSTASTDQLTNSAKAGNYLTRCTAPKEAQVWANLSGQSHLTSHEAYGNHYVGYWDIAFHERILTPFIGCTFHYSEHHGAMQHKPRSNATGPMRTGKRINKRIDGLPSNIAAYRYERDTGNLRLDGRTHCINIIKRPASKCQ